MHDCEQQLNYCFKDKLLLFEALTHSSSTEQRINSYERLEFLGDAILGLVVCQYLYQSFPDWDEGELTKVKSNVVSRVSCGEMAATLGLEKYLAVGKGVSNSQGVPKSLLANSFEALIAAIYLDSDIVEVENFLIPLIANQVDAAVGGGLIVNYKSDLQHYVQKRFGIPPVYLVMGTRGPDHNKEFKIAAQVLKRVFQPAWGTNKKEAEQRAAANALAVISGKKPPFDDL